MDSSSGQKLPGKTAMKEPKLHSALPPRMLNVGPAILQDFETVAVLQAIMMYPQREDAEKFFHAFMCFCADFSAEQERSVPEFAASLREFRPEYFTIEPRQYRATRRKSVTLFRYRALAALMARAFVGEALFGEAYVLPPGLKKLTPASVAAYVAACHKGTPNENLLHRAWRPSLPILPLAIGLNNALMVRMPARARKQMADELIEPEAFEFDLQDIDLCREAVRLSKLATDIVKNDRRIRIADNDLIAINWCE
jgi:hypothetical protein